MNVLQKIAKVLNEEVSLTDPTVVITKENQRYTWDRRRKFTWIVAEYLGSDGQPYRKSFYFDSSIPVDQAKNMIPKSGSNTELSDYRNKPFIN
jgi:hypothetical protein